jgi:hypothetical protein
LEARIEALDQKRVRLLDLYLDTSSNMPQDLLKSKMAEVTQERERYEKEARDLRERLSQSANLDQDAAQIRLYCEMASEGIDLFTEEDKRNTIAALNIMGIVQRGATPKEDKITLTGYIPTLEVVGTDEIAAKTLKSPDLT